MADYVDRIARDRALFDDGPRAHLFNLIANGNPHTMTQAVAKLIEMQVITEEIARERGVEVDPDVITEFLVGRQDEIAVQVKRAIMQFIASIVSQEG